MLISYLIIDASSDVKQKTCPTYSKISYQIVEKYLPTPGLVELPGTNEMITV
jgi:hypothetical protein